MEPAQTTVVWYIDIAPNAFIIDGGQLIIYLPGGKLSLWLGPDTIAFDINKPLRVSLAQPS